MTNHGDHLHTERHSSSCSLGSCSYITMSLLLNSPAKQSTNAFFPRLSVSWSTWAQVCGHAHLDRAILLLTDALLCSLPCWDGATEIQCIERKRKRKLHTRADESDVQKILDSFIQHPYDQIRNSIPACHGFLFGA